MKLMGSISYVKAVAVFVVFSLAGCANDIAEVDALTESVNTSIEEGSGVEILLSPQGRPTSWLEAETAVRSEKSNTFTARGNVRFYNKKNEKLVSTELIWDEAKSDDLQRKALTTATGSTSIGVVKIKPLPIKAAREVKCRIAQV